MRQASNPAQSPTIATPRTESELRAITVKRTELADQLRTVSERRQSLWQSLLAREPAAKGELQARMKALEDREARLEREILQADDAITTALAAGVGTPAPPPPPSTQVTVQPPRFVMGGEVGRIMFAEAVVFVLLGLLIWRFAWKRLAAKLTPAADHSRRFDQLQQAVDVIALEVERISEGQRYVAKVLNEQSQPVLGAGDAQHIPAEQRSAEPAAKSTEGR